MFRPPENRRDGVSGGSCEAETRRRRTGFQITCASSSLTSRFVPLSAIILQTKKTETTIHRLRKGHCQLISFQEGGRFRFVTNEDRPNPDKRCHNECTQSDPFPSNHS